MLALRSFLFTRLFWLASGNRMLLSKPNQRVLVDIRNTILWDHVHFLITTNRLAYLNADSRVPGANLPLKRTLSAPVVRNGDARLETKYTRETAF
ncbi:hypothetical protein PHISCL_05029 [Aspergillus sclerotialis]|uniref:Secreted protein n=1 Tax=Aspergillus sclerotialis TaxID=2070753 RepID=A0A3A2ZHX9_9EURO|nr:hypothetical protein PHISCL_05029 [Aspergillus sclerotialis]